MIESEFNLIGTKDAIEVLVLNETISAKDFRFRTLREMNRNGFKMGDECQIFIEQQTAWHTNAYIVSNSTPNKMQIDVYCPRLSFPKVRSFNPVSNYIVPQLQDCRIQNVINIDTCLSDELQNGSRVRFWDWKTSLWSYGHVIWRWNDPPDNTFAIRVDGQRFVNVESFKVDDPSRKMELIPNECDISLIACPLRYILAQSAPPKHLHNMQQLNLAEFQQQCRKIVNDAPVLSDDEQKVEFSRKHLYLKKKSFNDDNVDEEWNVSVTDVNEHIADMDFTNYDIEFEKEDMEYFCLPDLRKSQRLIEKKLALEMKMEVKKQLPMIENEFEHEIEFSFHFITI